MRAVTGGPVVGSRRALARKTRAASRAGEPVTAHHSRTPQLCADAEGSGPEVEEERHGKTWVLDTAWPPIRYTWNTTGARLPRGRAFTLSISNHETITQ